VAELRAALGDLDMQRALLMAAAALLMCALGYLLLDFFVQSGVPLGKLVLFTSAVTLLLAGVAVGFSIRALLRAAALHSDLTRLSRSLDMAVSGLAARTDRETSAVDALKDLVERKLAAPPGAALPAGPEPSNVVMLPPKRRFRPEVVAANLSDGEDDARMLQAIEDAMRAGLPDISLHRLVSVSRGDATGFDVLAHIPVSGTAGEDIDQPPAAAPEALKAAFSRWLLAGAIEAARRNAVGNGEAKPLHVRVQESLLGNGKELLAAVDALAAAPEIASSIILILPAAALQADADHDDALALVRSAGARLGADEWCGEPGSFEALADRGIAAFRVPAELLLGRGEDRRLLASPVAMIEMAAARGLPLVATGVASGEEEVAMMDLGVAQMTGPRFTGPRRLRPRARRDAAGS